MANPENQKRLFKRYTDAMGKLDLEQQREKK